MDKENKQSANIWGSLCETDPLYTGAVTYPGYDKVYTGTNLYYQLERITKLWGSFGSTWGIRTGSKYEYQSLGRSITAEFSGILFYPSVDMDGNKITAEFDIESSLEVLTKDSKFINPAYKKFLKEDALKKGLSFLGMSADIYKKNEVLGDSKGDPNTFIIFEDAQTEESKSSIVENTTQLLEDSINKANDEKEKYREEFILKVIECNFPKVKEDLLLGNFLSHSLSSIKGAIDGTKKLM